MAFGYDDAAILALTAGKALAPTWQPFAPTGYGNIPKEYQAWQNYLSGYKKPATGQEAYSYFAGYNPTGKYDAQMQQQMLQQMQQFAPSAQSQTAPKPDYASNLAQGQKAYNQKSIADIFAQVYGQMGRNQGTAVANSQRTAAMQAASGSYVNPGAYVQNAGQSARAPYVQALSQLGTQQAQAQMGAQQNLTNLMMQIELAKSGDKKAQDQLKYEYEALRQREEYLNRMMAWEREQKTPTGLDWLGTGLDIYGKGKSAGLWGG